MIMCVYVDIYRTKQKIMKLFIYGSVLLSMIRVFADAV